MKLHSTHVFTIDRGFNFEHIEQQLRTELGETLATLCAPKAIDAHRFELSVPQGSTGRIKETVRYALPVKHLKQTAVYVDGTWLTCNWNTRQNTLF